MIYILLYISMVQEAIIINTLYLTYALEVERVGSITQAAQNLFMAQPNLSKALKELEKEVGFQIFKRMPNGMQATEDGAEFLYHAKQIMDQLNAVDRIKQRNCSEEFKYRISIPRGSYIADGFTSYVAELNQYNGMEITINETNALGTIVNVADKGYNMGIIRYPVSEEGYFLTSLKNNKLNYEVIWEFEYVLVMSEDHPLAKKEMIELDDLREYVKITHGDIEIPHDKINSRNKSDHKEKIIYVYERGSQFDLLTKVPTTYMWVSPIPQAVLEKNHLIQRICKAENNFYKDVLIFREDYVLNEYDLLFEKKIYEAKVDVSNCVCN